MFAQNALAVLDRAVLVLIRQLPIGVGRKLIQAADDVRRVLGLPQPVVQLRDWPEDQQVGDALKILLARLKELESEEPEGSEPEGSELEGSKKDPENSDERSEALKKFLAHLVDVVSAGVWLKIKELEKDPEKDQENPNANDQFTKLAKQLIN